MGRLIPICCQTIVNFATSVHFVRVCISLKFSLPERRLLTKSTEVAKFTKKTAEPALYLMNL